MGNTPPAYWHLADLAATGDIAREYGASNATVSNWISRYPDFPAPLVVLSTGPVYSMWQVRQWHDSRRWTSGKPRRQAQQ